MTGHDVLPTWSWPSAAYIHIPFCAHHCGYCDFAVAAGQDHLIDQYIEAIGVEMARLGRPTPVDTIFIGGGTPTYLSAEHLAKLFDSINHWLPVRPGGEVSIESTPESIAPDKVAVLADRGVNRVSIGVQSFQAHLLKSLDRIHSPAHVGKALEAVRSRIDNVSLDLIFGAPEQTLKEWDADLSAGLAFAPNHFSTYGLTYEKGTPLWKQRQRGEVIAIGEQSELAMYERAIDRLTAAGFEQYEVSNFARPGHRCRHNETYWANEAYFGFGVGAARYVMGRREMNRRNVGDYVRVVLAGDDATFQSEELAPADRARETAAVQLRRSAGIGRSPFEKQTGFALEAVTAGRIEFFVAEGLLVDDGEAIRLTRRGQQVADGLVVKLVWG